MAIKDPYETFPVYKELRESLNTTKDGRDLMAILYKRKLPEGYLLKSTDRFYIDLGSKTYLRKLPDGRWYYTALSDGRPFSQMYYNTMEEMLKDVWIKGVVKRAPHDVKQADFRKWLQDPNCPARGKELKIQDITIMYLESLGEGYYIKNADSIFDDPKWKEIFNFIGTEKKISNDGLFRPTLSLGLLLPWDEKAPNFGFWEKLLLPYFGNDKTQLRFGMIRQNIHIIVKSSPKMGKLTWEPSNGSYEILVGAKTKEEMEKKVIETIVKIIKGSQFILERNYEDNLIAKLMVSLFSGAEEPTNHWAKGMADFVLENPTMLEKIPSNYRKIVMQEAGISEDLAGTIEYANYIGLL